VSRGFAVLLILFLFSGACGLTYQVLWLRLLSLVFGVTAYAASTVLASFMAGLALGSLVAAPLLRKFPRPLLIFGVAEILIGLSALATPIALAVAEDLYRMLYSSDVRSFAALTFVRLVCSFVVLLPPTVLMGVTLPILSASALLREQFGARISALYACNTAGAVVGAMLTGFELIGRIGIQRTFLLAAAVNLIVGATAVVWGRTRDSAAAADHKPETTGLGDTAGVMSPTRVFAFVIALSGVAALALEIVWFRMLVQYLDATTYAFTAMLVTVLAGIAIGGAIAAPLLRRRGDWIARLAGLQLATGIAIPLSAVALASTYRGGQDTAAALGASVVAIFPAAVLMGVSFPVALRLGVASDAAKNLSNGQSVGRLYALNVGGAIVGALFGGFVLLAQLGTRRALIAVAAIYIATACLLAFRARATNAALAFTIAGVAVFAYLATRVPDPFAAAFARRYGTDMREFWRDDGVQTAVSVHASQFRRSLYLDGLHQANDTPDMVRLHRIIGHLPMVLHPASADALVVGLGGGATAGAVSQYPGVRVQVVELSDGVRRAAPFFSHISYDLLQQPHVRLRIDDGRNFLLMSGDRFDVITADIIQPSHAGAGNLYSREYFTLVRHALKEHGLALQWIGHRPETQYRLIMRTFLDVFPEATLWLGGELMIGALAPFRIHPSIVDMKRSNPQTRAALDDIGLRDFETLANWYTAGSDDMRRFVGEGPLLTDDRPVVEYHRALPANDRPVDLSRLRGDVSRMISR
jgi:spermidine synthase